MTIESSVNLYTHTHRCYNPYIYTYLGTHVYTHTHIYMQMYVCMFVCMYVSIYLTGGEKLHSGYGSY